MKNKKIIIRIVTIIIIIIILILIGVFSLSYRITNNNNYKEKIINNIKKNFSQTDTIEYANIYNNYYIFTTKDKIYVLDDKYKEVLKEDLNKLAKNTNNYEIIYRDKKIMYENTIRSNNKVIYEYYDSKDYKKISSTNLEQ